MSSSPTQLFIGIIYCLSKGHTIIGTWIGNTGARLKQYCIMSVVTCVGVCFIRVFWFSF